MERDAICVQVGARDHLVEDGDRVHPIELFQESIRAPFRKPVRQHFGITQALELVPALFQLRFQFTVVVYLAVLKSDNLTSTAEERLPAALNIND